MKNVYLGRQPIIDNNGDLCAYKILYRDARKTSEISGDRHASASVINSVLNKFGTHAILGDRRGFVKIDEKFLMNDIILSVPKQFFIFALFQDVVMSEKVIERVQRLSAAGYLLGINGMELTAQSVAKYSVIFKELSFVQTTITLDLSVEAKELITTIKLNARTIAIERFEALQSFDAGSEHRRNHFGI